MRARAAVLSLLVFGSVGVAAQTTAQSVDPVYSPGNGIVNPLPTFRPDPKYTDAALQAKIQGVVVLQGTVTPTGELTDVRILQSLDAGLDQEAIRTAEQWRFKPGMRDGKPVSVRVTMELQFSLARQTQPPTPDATGVYKPGRGVTNPVVVKRVDPSYPEHADGVSRTVILEATVQPDGTTASVSVVRILDRDVFPAFEAEAIRALSAWQFTPGQANGVAVPVRITVEMSFRK